MSSSPFNDPEHWRKRAEEARKLASSMMDPQSKAVMVSIAEDYDGIAERAERRLREMSSK